MADVPNDNDLPLAHVPFRIGIVGGMGPMAGVYFQRLIIEATPAERDQDHLEVVCFTNPHVPERMRSLAEDGGKQFAAAVRDSARLLARAGATCIAVPCNTAHTRLPEIQTGVRVPVLDMIALTAHELVERYGTGRRVGLLATIGTLDERLYQQAAGSTIAEWILPDAAEQESVARAIKAVKVGGWCEDADDLRRLARRLAARGAEILVIGCTELALCYEALQGAGIPLVEPMRIMARHLVRLAGKRPRE